MTPKPKKTSSKSDVKTTVILILLIVVAVQGFLLYKNTKQRPARMPVATAPAAVKPTAPVERVTKTVVPPVAVKREVVAKPVVVPATPAPLPVTAVKKEPRGSAGKIAIILDDWGYTMRNCTYLQQIKQPITIAVLPNLRHSNDIQQCAKEAGKDIMLHLPMEPYHNNDHYPDNYLITTAMKPSDVSRLLEDTLNKMPLIEGVNNHMGSKATEDKPLMKLIYKHLRKRKLFFVDSMTSPHHSVCAELAAEMNMPFAQRDVFLDNVNVKEDIKQQIQELAHKARKKGYAIAIGHDRELTLQVLKEQLPLLEEQGFTIVRARDLVKTK